VRTLHLLIECSPDDEDGQSFLNIGRILRYAAERIEDGNMTVASLRGGVLLELDDNPAAFCLLK